jgi:hypothetical protein
LLLIMKLQGWNRHEEKQKQKIKVLFLLWKRNRGVEWLYVDYFTCSFFLILIDSSHWLYLMVKF